MSDFTYRSLINFFRNADKDGDGIIDEDEFQVAYKTYFNQQNISDDYLHLCYLGIYNEETKGMTFNGFRALYDCVISGIQPYAIIFRALDTDRDCHLTQDEFFRFVQSLANGKELLIEEYFQHYSKSNLISYRKSAAACGIFVLPSDNPYRQQNEGSIPTSAACYLI